MEARIDINTAPVEQLRLLGINDTVVKGIVEFRAQRLFRRKSDLLSVDGLGKVTQEKILANILPLQYDVNDPLDDGPMYLAELSAQVPMPEPTSLLA